MASGDRLKSYKTKGNVEEGRRRREEEGVQLRKLKREEQIAKRRNIDVDQNDDTTSGHRINGGSKEPTLTELINGLMSPQPSTVLTSATCIRKLLAKEDPPITNTVESGIIPLLVQFLTKDDQCTLQFECCWILTNVASGSSLHTRAVVETGAVPQLIRLLQSPFTNVQEQAVWALGNIAGDDVQLRDYVLGNGILDPLLSMYKNPTSNIGLLKCATWTLSNLCRGKNPPLKIEYAIKCLPVLSQLLYHDNQNVISDACWSLSFLADGSNKRIQLVIDAGVTLRLIELLLNPVKEVVSPALRCVGNLVTGDDVQTQVVLNCSVLTALERLCKSDHDSIRKEACWIVSNIAAGNKVQIQPKTTKKGKKDKRNSHGAVGKLSLEQHLPPLPLSCEISGALHLVQPGLTAGRQADEIQTLLDSGVLPILLDIMNTAEYKIRKEAVWAVCNAISGGTPEQIRYIVSLGFIGPLCDTLTVQTPKVVIVVLECLDNILKVGTLYQEHYHGVNPYAFKVEEANGLEKIEALQSHINESIYKLAYKLIDTYFDTEDDDENITPAQSNEQFLFATNTNLPPGGFQL